SLTAQPASLVSATAASFSFDASESASFACSLDGAAFAACTSPASYTGLTDASHTFSVRATDAAGSTGAARAAPWTPATTPPTASIAKPPTSPTNATGASFDFAASEPSRFACSLDGAGFTPCTSPAGYTGLADGSHTFSVQATDIAG